MNRVHLEDNNSFMLVCADTHLHGCSVYLGVFADERFDIGEVRVLAQLFRLVGDEQKKKKKRYNGILDAVERADERGHLFGELFVAGKGEVVDAHAAWQVAGDVIFIINTK